MAKIAIKVHDVAHKWVDITKTTTILTITNDFGITSNIAYIHSDDSVDEVHSKKESYEELLLSTIKDSIVWE